MRKISDILADDESIKRESPLLHSISKENPFSVPENYFDNLPSEIMEKCRAEIGSENLNSYFLNLKYLVLGYKWRLLAVTSCMALICFFAIHINNSPVSYEAMAQNIPDSLIVEHLDKNITYISESTLEDLQEQESSSPSVKSTSDSANTDQAIIAYLMTTNVNDSDIVNEP
jgi:hypothetical protein